MIPGRPFALLGYFGLLILWIAWGTVFSPARHAPTTLVLSASLLPLLAPLRGFLQARRSSYIWLGLLSQLYFIHGVGAFTDSAERILASLEITASLVLFTGSWAELRPKESS